MMHMTQTDAALLTACVIAIVLLIFVCLDYRRLEAERDKAHAKAARLRKYAGHQAAEIVALRNEVERRKHDAHMLTEVEQHWRRQAQVDRLMLRLVLHDPADGPFKADAA